MFKGMTEKKGYSTVLNCRGREGWNYIGGEGGRFSSNFSNSGGIKMK